MKWALDIYLIDDKLNQVINHSMSKLLFLQKIISKCKFGKTILAIMKCLKASSIHKIILYREIQKI